MDPLSIFSLQFVLSVVLFSLLARWYVAPWLKQKTQSEALFWLTLPHATRHLGLVFLIPGIVSSSLPSSFANAAAYGDLVAGILALLVLIALRHGWAGTLTLVWFFNIVGTVDLLNALRQAHAVPHLGAAWYIPTFWVPVLLVTHFMIFHRLFGNVTARAGKPQASPQERDVAFGQA